MIRNLLLFLAVVLGATPSLPAQRVYRPDVPHLKSLLSQVDSGHPETLSELEREGRFLAIYSAQYTVDLETALTAARISLHFGAPFTDAKSEVPPGERFWRRGAVRSLRRALEIDSGNVWVAERLEEFEPYPHVWIDPDRELEHLRALLAVHDTLPISLAKAALGMELERGDARLADQILRTIDSTQLSRAEFLHLRSEVEFALGLDSTAEHNYYAGAAAIIDSVDAAIYQADVSWLADESQLAEWRSLPLGLGEHEAWLRRFWTRRDLLDVAVPGSRLATHFERWRMALNRYRWDLEGAHALGEPTIPVMGIDYSDFETDTEFPIDGIPAGALANRFRPPDRVLDDRGAVVLRHGLPSVEANLAGVSSFGQATLAWDTPGGRLVIGFSRPALDMVSKAPNAKFGMVARNMPMGDLFVACAIDGDLCKLANRVERPSLEDPVEGGLPTIDAELMRMGLRQVDRYTVMRETAESTDGNPERVEKDLGAVVQSYGISGGGVLVSYAIPAAELGDPGTVVQARLKVVAGDSLAGTVVSSIDTVRRWRLPAELPEDAFLSGWFELPLPVGDWRVGVFIADSSGTSATSAVERSVVAVDTLAGVLILGDLILGRLSSGVNWQRFGELVPMNPTGAWRLDEQAVLTVEAYGMTPGKTYQHSVEVWDAAQSLTSPQLSISSPFSATSRSAVIQQIVGFESLEPGLYRLAFRVTDPESGESVLRQRELPLVNRPRD